LFCRVVIDNSENIFEQRMGVKVVEYSGTKQFKDWVPPVPREQLKSLGFDFWLKDIITGPEEVINTLCHQNQIHATVPPPQSPFIGSRLGYFSQTFYPRTKRGRRKFDGGESMGPSKPHREIHRGELRLHIHPQQIRPTQRVDECDQCYC